MAYKNREDHLRYHREYERRPERRAMRREYMREYKYGAGASEHIARLEEMQDGRCAICHEIQSLSLDHDHATGEWRRLLCGTCNSGLGMMQDNPRLLRVAAAYLESFNA